MHILQPKSARLFAWATYETEPDKPIVAAPIAVSPAQFQCSIQPRGNGLPQAG